MLLLKHFFTILLLAFSSLCFAQTQHYYILFSARFASFRPFSIGGHAFITWRSEDSAFQKVEQLTYGFFPKKGGGLFKSVEGSVVEGYVKNSNRERLVRRFMIEVDSALYAESLHHVDTWQAQFYNFFNKNCVDFMNEMAVKLDLKIPPPKSCIFPRRPSTYIRKLKKLNKIKLVKNISLEKVRLRILHKAKVDIEEDDDKED
jgi:hypothetical protein